MVGLGRPFHTRSAHVHTHTRTRAYTQKYNCRRLQTVAREGKRRENLFEPASTLNGERGSLPSFSEFHCPSHCPSRQQWRAPACSLAHAAIREGFSTLRTYLAYPRRPPSAKSGRCFRRRFSTLSLASVAAVIAHTLTHNLMRYRLTGRPRRPCIRALWPNARMAEK